MEISCTPGFLYTLLHLFYLPPLPSTCQLPNSTLALISVFFSFLIATLPWIFGWWRTQATVVVCRVFPISAAEAHKSFIGVLSQYSQLINLWRWPDPGIHRHEPHSFHLLIMDLTELQWMFSTQITFSPIFLGVFLGFQSVMVVGNTNNSVNRPTRHWRPFTTVTWHIHYNELISVPYHVRLPPPIGRISVELGQSF